MTPTRPCVLAMRLASSWSDALGALVSNGGMTVDEYNRMLDLKRALDRFSEGRDA